MIIYAFDKFTAKAEIGLLARQKYWRQGITEEAL
jgi:hypothetical protein